MSALVIRNLGSAAGIAGPPELRIAEGRIESTEPGAVPAGDARVLDARGLLAAPGFIELQLNGALGRDFTSDPAAMWVVGRDLARWGITAFLPTIVTSPRGTVEAALAAWSSPPDTAAGAVPLGLHVEGPFLSPARAGAHDPALLRDPDLDEIAGWATGGGLRLLTLAPERAGALDAIGLLTGHGVVVSVGHTDADAATARSAIDAGARYATHLFNAMAPFSHRAPGVAGALLADDRVTIGLILDRHHLDPVVVSLVERMARGRVSLVSDAIAALGLADGSHRLADREVLVRDDAARLSDGTLAGSVTALDACVRAFAAMTGSSLEALRAVTAVPASLLGLTDGRGDLRVGGRADVVLLDDELEVQATLVAGEIAYAAEDLGWG